MYNHSLPAFMVDDPSQQGVAGFNGGEGRAGSPMNGDRGLESPQTQEQLIANNSSLKTRVRELEFINELFRGRLSQLEQQEAAASAALRGQEVAGVEHTQLRAQLDASKEMENQLRIQLEDSHRRENNLKRRLDELELELRATKEALSEADSRPYKKARIIDSEEAVKAEAADALAAVAVAVAPELMADAHMTEIAAEEPVTEAIEAPTSAPIDGAVEPSSEATVDQHTELAAEGTAGEAVETAAEPAPEATEELSVEPPTDTAAEVAIETAAEPPTEAEAEQTPDASEPAIPEATDVAPELEGAAAPAEVVA